MAHFSITALQIFYMNSGAGIDGAVNLAPVQMAGALFIGQEEG